MKQSDHIVRFSVDGSEPVVIRVPGSKDIADLLNRCRARVFPDVAMVPAGQESVAKPRRRR